MFRTRKFCPVQCSPVSGSVESLSQDQLSSPISPEGTTITVGAQLDGELVRVSVSDEGSGVPPDDRARIFKMLDRRAGSGRAGLGLAISTSFVAAHSQTLSVDDAPSGGARFSFTLPVSATEEFDE